MQLYACVNNQLFIYSNSWWRALLGQCIGHVDVTFTLLIQPGIACSCKQAALDIPRLEFKLRCEILLLLNMADMLLWVRLE